MKILLANKYFYIRGGADRAFFNEASLLESKGHEIGYFSMHHPRNAASRYDSYFVSGVDYQEKMGVWRKLQEAGRILYSLEAKKKMRRLLQRERFDLIHLHNIYHQLSPSILDAIAASGIPAVMTLHDYKMVCPTYSLFSKGGVCELCSQGRYFHCLVRRCSKGSYTYSLINALEMYLHHSLMGLYGKVKLFISTSRFTKDKLREMGFPREIRHLPNFINAQAHTPDSGWQERSLVFFGRLSREKGLHTLIQAMAGLHATLKLIGEGPERPALEGTVRQSGLNNIQFLGYRQGASLFAEIKKSMFAVIPSEWYENHPLSVLEAFALGKPVLGARIGGIPELVVDYETGLTFEPGNVQDLRGKIRFLLETPELLVQMGKNARDFVERELNPERHYAELLQIYKELAGR